MKNKIGKVRQSSVLMNYGPGAIIDFRSEDEGAAVSVVATGLEEWEKSLENANGSQTDMRRFVEARLCAKLGVTHFRLPPVSLDTKKKDEFSGVNLTGVRFPIWLQCPKCNIIQQSRRWASEAGRVSRYCATCSANRPYHERVYVVPVRFILSCRNGHLEDFPWHNWVHGNNECKNNKKFKLTSKGAGLAGLIVECPECLRSSSLEHIFSPDAHAYRKCNGKRPWLANADERCDLRPVTMQRGASNLYFARFESALVIPPWSEEVIRRLGYQWHQIESLTTSEQRKTYIELVWLTQISPCVGNMPIATFTALVEEKIATASAMTGNLRLDEYRQFGIASDVSSKNSSDFDIRIEQDISSHIPHIESLIRVVSLREVRALKSFTRIEAFPGSPPVKVQPLSAGAVSWLPAIEVRGEGIFLSLDRKRLHSWLKNEAVISRAKTIQESSTSNVLNPKNNNDPVPATLTARMLLLHSLSHALMKQLSLQCGYSSASLRELLYVGEADEEMCGILIYTSTSDSDGTLGGLQRQGRSHNFSQTFVEAIRASEWCASDPLCVTGVMTSSDTTNLAACHSCLLAPETSCQDFNKFLDRAMLVGTPDDKTIGFFSNLLEKN